MNKNKKKYTALLLEGKCGLIFATDGETPREVDFLVNSLGIGLVVLMVRVGAEIFNKYGREVTGVLTNKGYKVFLDLRLRETPSEIGPAIERLENTHLRFLSIDMSGGEDMLLAACKAREGTQIKLFGVTPLIGINSEATSLSPAAEKHTIELGEQAVRCGLEGLLCSPLELPVLRKKLGPEPILIVLGIYPRWADKRDFEPVLTPTQAIKAGASYIVVDRPITHAVVDYNLERHRALSLVEEEMGRSLLTNIYEDVP